MGEMQQVAAESPELSGVAKQRAEAALATRSAPDTIDIAATRRQFAQLLAGQGSLNA
jgi:beta-N-acetylhexosaminidase